MSDVTRILEAAQRGDPKAADELLPLVYEELRKLAAAKMAQERPGQTLQPTALVHEAWLRLTREENARWDGRTHFFAAAAEAMRRILIESARRKRAVRHGGGQQRLDVHEIEVPAGIQEEELLEMDEVLERLVAEDKVKGDLVKLRYFVGLTIEEAADLLGISVTTANRHWRFARAWLIKEIKAQR